LVTVIPETELKLVWRWSPNQNRNVEQIMEKFGNVTWLEIIWKQNFGCKSIKLSLRTNQGQINISTTFPSHSNQKLSWSSYAPASQMPHWTLEYGQLVVRDSTGNPVSSYGSPVDPSEAPTSLVLELTDRKRCLPRIMSRTGREIWAASKLKMVSLPI